MDSKKLKRIHKSRVLLKNPYAHVAGDEGQVDAILPPVVSAQEIRGANTLGSAYSQSQIEEIAKRCRKILWERREQLGYPDADPIQFTDPTIAFEAMGYEFDTVGSLGELIGANSEMAGFIDATNNRAKVSTRFPPNVQLFTAAHELGHAILHDARGLGLHREINNDGTMQFNKPPIEKQADQFAAAFLMPENLIRKQFIQRFNTDCFTLNSDNMYGLTSSGQPQKFNSARELSRILAKAIRFHDRSFPSLVEFFKLSPEAVAIRIEVTGLINLD